MAPRHQHGGASLRFLSPSACCDDVAAPHAVPPSLCHRPSHHPRQPNSTNLLDPPHHIRQLVYLYVVAAMLRGGPSPSPATLVHSSTLGQGRLRGARDSRMHRSDVPALPDVRAYMYMELKRMHDPHNGNNPLSLLPSPNTPFN